MEDTELRALEARQLEIEVEMTKIRQQVNKLDEEFHVIHQEYQLLNQKIEEPLAKTFAAYERLEDVPLDVFSKAMNAYGYKSREMYDVIQKLYEKHNVSLTGLWPENNQKCINFSRYYLCTQESNYLKLNDIALAKFVSALEYTFENTPPLNDKTNDYEVLPKLGEEVTDVHELNCRFWVFQLGSNAYKGQYVGVVIKHHGQFLCAMQVTSYSQSEIVDTEWEPIRIVIGRHYESILDRDD